MSSKSTVEDLSKLLKKFDAEVLKTMMEATKMDFTKDANEMSDDLIDWSYEQGIKKFVEKLDAKTLKTSMKEASIDVGDSDSLEALGEKFLDSVEQDPNGPEGFLGKMNMSTLKKFAKLLNFETDAADEKQFAEDIADQFLLDGTTLILAHLSEEELKKTCENLKLKTKNNHTKNNYTELILSQVFNGILPDEEEEEEPKKEKKSKEKKEKKSTKEKKEKKTTKKADGKKEAKNKREEEAQKIKENRAPLEECKDKDEIFQNYWADELKEFCKKNGINSQGNKKELIKRILDFNEDPENKGFVTKKRKRKSASSTKNKKKKETKDSTNGSEETEETKEETKEEAKEE